MMTSVDQQLASDAYIQSPYEVYELLRAEQPVYWSEAWSAWVLTRYADVKEVLNDYGRFSNRGRYTLYLSQLPDEQLAQLRGLIEHYEHGGLVQSDPPEHTRLRRLVNIAFTPRAVAQMEALVVEIVNDLLDEVAPRGELEMIRDFAFPLPSIVIAGMLGVPKDERDQFKDWSFKIQRFLGGGKVRFDHALEAQQSWQRMNSTFAALLAERRRTPQNDLLSALAHARDNEERLGEDELIRTCGAMLIAGHETTTNLISSGILALLQNPQQMARLHNDPELINTAVEEFLRYDSPFQSLPRTVTRDTELHGQTLREGQLVYAMLGAANRDPAQFAAPDQLNIGRIPNKHLAFGHGIHFCLGATLARLEGPIAISALLQRLPNLRLVPNNPPIWKKSMVQRGLATLPLRF